MKRIKSVGYVFSACAMFILLGACVPSVTMKHDVLTKVKMSRGPVVVGTVHDKRAVERRSFEAIGTVRGGYGNPFTVKTEPGRGVDILLKEVATAALEHTGYSTEKTAKKAPRLDIDVLNFWCDGYQGYVVDADLAVKLTDPKNGKILARKGIQVKRGFALVMGYGPMHDAFDEVMNEIQKQLVIFMQSKEFRTAAQ